MKRTIQPARRISGKITLPGDKSISHRAVILGALAAGTSTVCNFPASRDCLSTVKCIRALGVKIKRISGSTLKIDGVGLEGLRKAAADANRGTFP